MRHRVKNTVALFSYATYTVHGGDVCVLLAGHCSSTSPPPPRDTGVGVWPVVIILTYAIVTRARGRGMGVECRNKISSVFKVSQLSQKYFNGCIEGHFVTLTDIWCKNCQKMLRNVNTGAVNVQALSLIHFHPCTSFHCALPLFKRTRLRKSNIIWT